MPQRQDFASLLEQSFSVASDRASRRLKAHDIVEVSVVGVTDDTIFVDAGTPADGRIPASDFAGPSENLRLPVGARVRAVVEDPRPDGPLLSGVLRAERLAPEDLEHLSKTRMPVGGRVTRATRGGIEVSVGGCRAFCPASHVDARRPDSLEDYVGLDLVFLILEVNEQGKNIIVSRRAYLDAIRRLSEESNDSAESEQAPSPKPDDALDLAGDQVIGATVLSHKRSGLIVRTSQGEGFLHLRELELAPGSDPRRAFPVGHELKVVFVGSDNAGRPRFSARRVRDVEERKNFQEYSEKGPAAAKLGSFGELLRAKLGLSLPEQPPPATANETPQAAAEPHPVRQTPPEPPQSAGPSARHGSQPEGIETRESEVRSSRGSVVRRRRR